MMMRLLVAVAALVVLAGAHGATSRPNVLFIAVDDLKPTIGAYGDKQAKTPALDRLAARGTLFERAYCMQAICSPSRNSVMTGLRPEVLRIYNLETHFRKRTPDVVTVSQHFKNNGYESHGLGKIFHVGHGNHEDAASWSVPHFQPKAPQYVRPENKVPVSGTNTPKGVAFEAADVPDDAYADGKIATEAISRLRGFKERGKPFFLAVGFIKPHLPFCAPRRYWDLYERSAFSLPERTTPPDQAPSFAPQFGGELRTYQGIPPRGVLPDDLTRDLIHGYYAATSYMDAQLGRVLDELDRLGLASNTIVVLWGDHGWHLGDHGMWCKHTNYEEATRAPLMVAAPGHPPRQKTRALAEFVDIYPTLCELANLPKPKHLQGDSLVPLLQQPGAVGKKAAFQVYPRGTQDHGPLLGHAVRTDRWRYVEWQKADRTVVARELYDHRTDPHENRNLAEKAEFADVVTEHSGLIKDRLDAPNPRGLKRMDVQPEQATRRPAVNRAALFERRDSNGDGKLTHEEFKKQQPDPLEAPKRFTVFDANKDGVLSRDEFIHSGKVAQ